MGKTNSKQAEEQELQTRHLYLMRHGKAKKSGADMERPLGKRGKKDVKKMRNLMLSKHVRPDLILCSPAARTAQTLKKLKKAFDTAEVMFVDDLYSAEAAEILDVLRATSPEKREVLVIGHNPALQELLPMVAAEPDENHAHNHTVDEGFPTSALACLELEHPWHTLGEKPVRLMNFIYSSDL